MAEHLGLECCVGFCCEADIDRAPFSTRVQLKEVKPRAAVLAAQISVLGCAGMCWGVLGCAVSSGRV